MVGYFGLVKPRLTTVSSNIARFSFQAHSFSLRSFVSGSLVLLANRRISVMVDGQSELSTKDVGDSTFEISKPSIQQ